MADSLGSELAAAQSRHGAGHIPGEPGVWLLITGDLVLFSLLFGLFLHTRAQQPDVFEAGRATLNQGYGLLNTVLMLSSSWLVASAVQAARRQQAVIASRCFGGALLCGLGFMLVKVFEYREKLLAGYGISTNDFYMLYFIYTGIHLIHVTLGSGVLGWLVAYSRGGGIDAVKQRNLESGASFWHLVDLLWIVLFALLYLVGAP